MTGSSVKSVLSRIVRIVESFEPDIPALRVSDIARRADLHVATASRLIEELVRYGWLYRDGDRRIRIGLRLWEDASRASPTLGLREAAMPFMEDLHAVVGHHVQLGLRNECEVLFVERLSAPGAVINLTRIAGRLPLHASSSGVVLLAYGPAWLQEKVLTGPLRAYTSQTIVDSGQLRTMLADIRRNGSAVCRGFIDERAAGVAVPIRGRDTTVLAALSAVVPNDAYARTHLPALQAAARGISRAMGHHAPRDEVQRFSQ